MARNVFVIGGWDRFHAVSEDGSDWKDIEFEEDDRQFCTGIAFGAGQCGMLWKRGYHGDSYLTISSNGSTWDETKLETDEPGHSLAWYDGKFIVCTGKTINRGHKPKTYLTEDGKKWSKAHEVGGQSIMTHYVEGNERLLGIGPDGMAATTTNGADWKVAELASQDSMVSLAFGNGAFVGGGLHGKIMRSEDGLKWDQVNTGREGDHINSMIWDGTKFIGVGMESTFASTDGKSWESVPNENPPLNAVMGANGLFLGCQWKARLMGSEDGVTWNEGHVFERHIEIIAYGSLES